MKSVDQKIIERFSNLLGNEKVRINEPMNRHTTFRIGGPADYFLLPSSSEEVKGILKICKEESLQYFILGNGSNLLVSDEGYRGVIIQLYRNYGGLTVEGTEIRAGAGVLLSQIAAAARNESLTGFEFAGGIPGTLGGAVVMNAGAYGGELKDVLKEAVVMDREGNIFTVPVEKLAMGYRTSLVKTAGYLVLEVVISLKKGSQEEIRDTMKDLADRRISKQPLEYPSAGSTFKRPEGYFAGKLIMDAGLRGYQVGGAQVSEKHCGFVINKGNATAADVCRLMADVQAKVQEQFGVTLEPEVKFLGDFDRR
jgi:UDP-N-acetylmuramate dehydrogenase